MNYKQNTEITICGYNIPQYSLLMRTLHNISTLWNWSDLSTNTCEMLLEKGGMDLYFLVF